MTDREVPLRGPIGEPIEPEALPPAQRAAWIDALMALPIKQRPQITIFGDDDVVGINPAPMSKTRDS